MERPDYKFKEKQEVAGTFLEYFSNNGYYIDQAVPLICEDRSVLFTNCTLNPWKKYIFRESIPKEGICMKQSCLRLRVLNDSIEKESELETKFDRFIGYFNVVGLLAEAKNEDKLIDNILDLLRNHYNIPDRRIRVMASKEDSFVKSLEGKVSIEYNTQDRAFYRWTYGMHGVYGCGATFSLLQDSGDYREIGQLIKIVSPEGKDTFEFGFGIETFLSRLSSWPDYRAWTIFHCFPGQYRFKTLLDLASCFGATATIDSKLFTRKHRKEVIRLAKKLANCEKVFGIPERLLESSINRFINIEFNYDSRDYVSDKLSHARELIR